ncbi:MAG: hypothetical protein ACI8QS_002537 [Planctomycetota bacterium]|jgi:hypothetical protein
MSLLKKSDGPGTGEPGKPRSRRRRLFVAGITFFGSAVLVLAFVEAWARTASPFGIHYYVETSSYLGRAVQFPGDAIHPGGRIFENKPGGQLDLRRFGFHTDGDGLRDGVPNEDRRPERRDGDPLRLLFLGDSVTLGWGVNDEDSWIRTLERNTRGIGGRELDCLNAGHLIYNTLQQADWFDAHGARLAPDAVVLTFVTNDVQDDHWALYQEVQAAAEQANGNSTVSFGDKLERFWNTNFPGIRRLLIFVRERQGARQDAQLEAIVVEEFPGYDEGWARCEAGLNRVLKQAKSLGISLIILDHGTPPIGAVQAWCDANSVPWYDFTFTPEEWAQDVRVSPADSHANPLGNRFLFQKAWAALADNKIIEGDT